MVAALRSPSTRLAKHVDSRFWFGSEHGIDRDPSMRTLAYAQATVANSEFRCAMPPFRHVYQDSRLLVILYEGRYENEILFDLNQYSDPFDPSFPPKRLDATAVTETDIDQRQREIFRLRKLTRLTNEMHPTHANEMHPTHDPACPARRKGCVA